MQRIETIKPYVATVDGVRYIRKDKYFLIVYFSENSTLIDDYPTLKIKQQDVRNVIYPITKYPRLLLKNDVVKHYKNIGLNVYPSTVKTLPKANFLYDTSIYTASIEHLFRPQTYRQRYGSFVRSIVGSPPSLYPGRETVLLYSVNLDRPVNKNIVNRKVYAILQDMKDGSFQYDYFLYNVIRNGKSTYRILAKNGEVDMPKIIMYLRGMTQTPTKLEEEEPERTPEEAEVINRSVDKVIDHVKDNIAEKNKPKIFSAVKSFLTRNIHAANQIANDEHEADDLKRVAIGSIFYRTIGNMNRSLRVARNIPREKLEPFLKVVDKKYVDEMLAKHPSTNNSRVPIIKASNIEKLTDNKNPKHLFEKRWVDFHTNLEKDLYNVCRMFENRDVPLKLIDFHVDHIVGKANETEKSDISTMKAILQDNFGNEHKVYVDIPRIDPLTGIFRLGGRAKCLINQIVLCPIIFPEPYDAKFESSYSIFHIYSKRTKTAKYLTIYLGSFKNLPLLAVCAYGFGFDETMKLYGIEYEISTVKPAKKQPNVCRLSETEYLYFKNVDSELKSQLVASLIAEDIHEYKIQQPFPSKEYFEDLLQAITDNVSVTYLISTNFENIVDPIAIQVLQAKGLPTSLDLIIKYMAIRAVDGYAEQRNDLSNQRLRGSEIIAQLLQKQLLSAYTVFKQQSLAGSMHPKFVVQQRSLLSAFLMSDIVADMEYANPAEEMAVMTRISPVGKGIGGLPTKEAIQADARNVHLTYFGNIDPFDTPEGPNIGVVQQLSMDAEVTSARGIFNVRPPTNNIGSGLLSTSSSLIPFIENDDGGRILMSDSQVKQMLPLKNLEIPAVMTGYESILPSVLSPNFVKKSPADGTVRSVSKDFILIDHADGRERINLMPIHLRSGFGRDTLSTFRSTVKSGDKVKAGEIVAEGACIKDGMLALGRMFLVAFMPYKGYDYEDGVVISESVVKSEKLVSLHGIVDEILVSEKDRVLYICNIGEYVKKGDPLIRKTIGEIEELLGYEEDETTAVYGQELIKKSPGGVVVDIDVYANVDISRYPLLRDLANRTHQRTGTPPDDKFLIKGKKIEGILIKFKIQQELNIDVGDKLSGRHGNKGVICLVEKDENMPQCYDKETEILTREGWKKFSDLNVNDEVAYMKDLDNKISGFTKPTNYYSKHYTGKMHGYKSKRMDYLVTPNHRMFCKTKYDKHHGQNVFTIQLAEEIHGKCVYHLANTTYDNNSVNHKVVLEKTSEKSGKLCKYEFDSIDFCELLGWYISEGSLSYYKSTKKYKHGHSFSYKVQISQCRNAHPEECRNIENLLNRMGLKWYYNRAYYQFGNKSIYKFFKQLGQCDTKYIPSEILNNADTDSLTALFHALMDGDGSYVKNGNFTYYTTSKRLADDISRLCFLLGYHSSAPCIQTKGRKLPKYCIYINKTKNIELSSNKEQYHTVDYDDDIFCVEVPNGLVFVRRNGKQFWCGNTPWGEKVEIILNPIGIINRMNIGQLYELYCGLISKDMATRIKNYDSKEKILLVFKGVLPLLDNSAGKHFSEEIIKNLEKMSDEAFWRTINDIRQRGFVPLVFPSFRSPNTEQIMSALTRLGLKSGYKLWLPEYNTYTQKEVAVGYKYISKLEHIGELKVHARSTGPVTTKTGQPTAGKRHEGGQRVGELDSYCILSYNTPLLLSELMGSMSDDMVSRNEMMSEIINTGECAYRVPKVSMARELLGAYMLALMLDQREMGER